MDQVLKYLPENTLVLIAIGLGIFFLFAAFLKGIRTRHHRQLRESAAAAAANGGTAEAPVHFGNPFEITPPSPPNDTPPETPAPDAKQEAAVNANEPDDNEYVWE